MGNVTMCFSPVAVADNTFAGYGCGPCPNTTTNATCVECTNDPATPDTACNAYTAPTHSYQCYVNKVATDCTPAPAITCFMANTTYAGNDATLLAGGCGSCSALVNITDGDCMECNTDLCNSAMKVASFVGPLLAVLFWLH